jgi:hypothetical protein
MKYQLFWDFEKKRGNRFQLILADFNAVKNILIPVLASLGHNWTEKLFRDQHMSCFSIITL